MSLLHRVILPTLAAAALGFLIACGGGTNNSVPPPSGGFTNSDFNGTYTFSIAGNDPSVTCESEFGESACLGAYSAAGTITASSGKITAGTVDIYDVSGVIAQAATVNASASTYNLNPNGIGTLTLNFGNQIAPLSFTFVLTDAAHGYIMEYDNSGAGGSGTIDLQPNPVTLSNSSYAFSISGGTMVGTSSSGISTPLATVGAFTLDSGAVTGMADLNNDGSPATALPLTGNISAPSGTTPGTATLTISNVGTLVFHVYAIDATHLKLIETDQQAVFVGDLFSQPSTSIPAATLAFTMASLNIPGLSNGSSTSVLAVGGTVASDGSSMLTNGSEFSDSNGTLNTSSTSFTGGFTSLPTGNTIGRYGVTLTGFTGGSNFAAYPSSGGILMLEVDSASTLGVGGITAGVAMAQDSPGGVAASQGYALNLTGADLADGTELDQIAQFNTTSSKISGTMYQNDLGGTVNGGNPLQSYGIGGSSSFTTGATGEVVLAFNGIQEGVLNFGVDSATSLVLAGDTNGDVSLGVLEQQGSPTSTADVAARHLAMVKAAAFAHARTARKKKQL